MSIFSIFLIELHVLYKRECISMVLLYMWVKYGLIWMSLSAQNEFFWFSEILAIVNPIINFKVLALAQIKSYKLKFFSQCQFHIDTAQNKWLKLQAPTWCKMEHPTAHLAKPQLKIIYSCLAYKPQNLFIFWDIQTLTENFGFFCTLIQLLNK